MNKPKVLIIGPTPPPYMGPSVATKMIIESKLKYKYDMVHLDTADRRSLANIGRVDISDIINAFIQLIKLVSFLLKFSPRIVYLPICQTIKGYLRDIVFILISRLFGAHIIIHLRGGYFRELYEVSNSFVKFIIRFSFRFINRAIVLGESLRNIFKGFLPFSHIVVVPNGIDEDYITDSELAYAQKRRLTAKSLNSSGSLSNSKYHILFLSNIDLRKGFYDVIKAIPIFITQMRNVKFLFAGEIWEPEKIIHSVREYIKKKNIESYIEFCGRVVEKDKKELLLQSDILVLPTYYKYEGQPWVIIEAMAAGLPIISTDYGCIAEIIVDGKNGYIIKEKNPREIADKLLNVLRNNTFRKSSSKLNREKFKRLYTKEVFIEGLIKVFDTVLFEVNNNYYA